MPTIPQESGPNDEITIARAADSHVVVPREAADDIWITATDLGVLAWTLGKREWVQVADIHARFPELTTAQVANIATTLKARGYVE